MRITLFFYCCFFVLLCQQGHAQDTKKIVQLSGIVLDHQDSSRIIGAHVYVPTSGRGATSNHVGYFSFPVLEGDRIVISYVGYKSRHYQVPDSSSEFITVRITMSQDATLLDEIEIVPFPTEDAFKEAVLALNVPLDNGLYTQALNAGLFTTMSRMPFASAYSNYTFYMNQYPSQINDRFQGRTNPFLDPLKWFRFIRDLKKTRKKKKK